MKEYVLKILNEAQKDAVQKLSVGAAILHNGKLLMLKRCEGDFFPNIYELPGGALELNESLLDALERELLEETNCKIEKILGYIGSIDFLSSTGLRTRRFNFLVEPKLPMMIQLTEHENFMWISPTDADRHVITPQTLKIIFLIRDNSIHYF